MVLSFLQNFLHTTESINDTFRDGCLDRWLFYSVQEARPVIGSKLAENNSE